MIKIIIKRFSLFGVIMIIFGAFHLLGFGASVSTKDIMGTLLMIFGWIIIEFKSLYEDL